MAFQDVLNAVARVVGGTQPDDAHTTAVVDPEDGFDYRPYWFSGADAGDGTGIPGVVGCYSLPVGKLDVTPVGMVLSATWKREGQFPTQGQKFLSDELRVRVLTGHDNVTGDMAFLVNFRDLVEPAFDTHMELFGAAGVTAADAQSGEFLEIDLGGTTYLAAEVVVMVRRAVSVTYTA